MGKGGGRKGRDTTGYHQQGPQKDKSDPNWKPTRGGKRARKQAELYQRRYQEWLESLGVPEPREQEESGADSDSSGFPDFPGRLELITSLEDQPKAASSSGSAVAAKPDFGFGTPKPSGDTVAEVPKKKLRLPRPRTPTEAAVEAPPTVPAPKGLGIPPPPKASVIRPAKAKGPPAISGVSRQGAAVPVRPAAPKAPPKSAPSVNPVATPKVPVPPKGPPPKNRPLLADIVVDLTAADRSADIPRFVPAVDDTEVRFVLDYNGTSNTDRPGSKQLDRFHNDTIQAIVDCLRNSSKHKIGIKSYIGLHGAKSQQRRESLRTQVVFLNQYLK